MQIWHLNLNGVSWGVKKKFLRSDFANKALKSKSSFQTTLNAQRDYFETNRMWDRNENGQLFERADSRAIKRYIYTGEAGWIDMHHLFYAMAVAENIIFILLNN